MASVGNAPNESSGASISWKDAPKDKVLAELDRILKSHHFHSTKKCSRFLRHIVEASLNGHFEGLKERTLGVDVFDREPHYDTNQDPVVRGTAGEVRKRLAQYYWEAGDSPIRLTLSPGSYVPELYSIAHNGKVAVQTEIPAATKREKRSGRLGMVAAVVLAFTLVTLSLDWMLRPTELDRFWGPVLGGKTVLICMGQPQYYTFRFSTARALNSWFAEDGDERKPPQIVSVPLGEIVPMWDKSVSLADAQAFSHLVNLLARKRKQFDLRGERSVSLLDLHRRPCVLIGAFNNDWTLNLTGELRFYFDSNAATRSQFIRDRQRPRAREWQLVDAWPPGKDIVKDYALVTRVLNHTTEQTTIVVGGISQYGTEAAAEFVTDPAYFERALANAPRDWYRKNIQVVLSTRVLSGVSGPPKVVATYFW